MQKEQITDREAIYLIIIFVMGTSLILGVGGEAKNDIWLAELAGLIMVIPMIFVYSRILSLFPGKDLFDILNIILGKTAGKIIAVIYIWYAFHLGAIILRNFGEFIDVVALPETPLIVPLACMGWVCIVGVRLGIEVLGRTTAYFFPFILFIVVFVELLGIPELHLNYIKPVLGNGLKPILMGGFQTFSFPFAETVLFLGVLGSLKTKKSPFKVYSLGIMISAIAILFVTLRNIAVLGGMLDTFKFPSYAAVSRISVGDFLQRIEVSVSIVFLYGAFIKSSICLLVACKGIEKVLNLKNYRTIVIQIGLLMIYFSYIVYENSMEMRYWAFKVYQYYTFPMQVILPLVIWVFAEIKARNK